LKFRKIKDIYSMSSSWNEKILLAHNPPPIAISSQVRPQLIQFMYALLAPVFTDKQLHT